MDTQQLASRAAASLIRDKEDIAHAVTVALYAERGDILMQKHGERGREKTLQDMRYNIEHLLPAVELADGSMFARYVEWLNAMLNSRNVSTIDVIRCLELLKDECRKRYPENQAAIGPIIDAGLAVVKP